MTALRQRMDEAMVLRGFALRTRETYLACVTGLAKHYHCPPDRLDSVQIQAYLCAISPTVKAIAADDNDSAKPVFATEQYISGRKGIVMTNNC